MASPAKLCPICGLRYDGAATFCQKDGARLTKQGERDPFVGLMLLGQFRIEEAIGAGGMGTVYRARQTTLGRDVAIKILHPELTRNPDAVRRFHREAKVATTLEHPNLVRVSLFGELPSTPDNPDGGLYLVMEYLDGRPLVDMMREEGPLPVSRALHLVLQIADAVAAAHAQGIVHRDIKPENVIAIHKRGDPDFIKVLDFGIARLLWDEQSALTQSGVIFGTARYISPEGASGEPTDARSDVYSIGVLAYQLLTGVTPFEASTPVAMLMKHIHEEAPDLRRMGLGAQVPPELAEVIMRCLAKNPDMRWDDAAQLADALRVAAETTHVTLPSSRRTWSMVPEASGLQSISYGGLSRPLPPVRRKHPSRWALVAAFVLGATAVTGGALLLKNALTETVADSPLMELERRARLALDQGRFDEPADDNVETLTEQILAIDAHHAGALALRREAVARLRDRATTAREAGDLDRAQRELLRLLHFLPADRPARAALQEVDEERRALALRAGVSVEPEQPVPGAPAGFVGIAPQEGTVKAARFEVIRDGRRVARVAAVRIGSSRRWTGSHTFSRPGSHGVRFVVERETGAALEYDLSVDVAGAAVASRPRSRRARRSPTAERSTAPATPMTAPRTPQVTPPAEAAGQEGIDWGIPPFRPVQPPGVQPAPTAPPIEDDPAPPPWTGSGSVI